MVGRPGFDSGRDARQATGASDVFWYCVAPEGSFHLAVAMVETNWLRHRVRWVVRPLAAERRGDALADDPAALQAVFGAGEDSRLPG